MFIFKLIPSKVFSLQARKPTGLVGRYLINRIFNVGNADLNSFVLDMLELESSDRILEIGFGSGKLINQMAEITTDGVVEGIDFSEVMLKQASRVNKHHLTHGKVRLQRGECKSLPFENGSFNKLCSVNTLYFWKDPDKYFREMFRVIRAGGVIVIGFRDEQQMSNLNLSKDIFTTYSQNAVVDLLSRAGFSDARVVKQKGKPFLSYCAVATKE